MGSWTNLINIDQWGGVPIDQRGGVLPIRGCFARKGYLFQVSGLYAGKRIEILQVDMYQRVKRNLSFSCFKEP